MAVDLLALNGRPRCRVTSAMGNDQFVVVSHRCRSRSRVPCLFVAVHCQHSHLLDPDLESRDDRVEPSVEVAEKVRVPRRNSMTHICEAAKLHEVAVGNEVL